MYVYPSGHSVQQICLLEEKIKLKFMLLTPNPSRLSSLSHCSRGTVI